MVERRRWQCPRCGRRWDIPIGHDPESCPKCAREAPQPPGAATGDEPRNPTDDEATFVPLPPELRMDTEAVRSYARVAKRRQRRPFTIMVAIAAVACFLALGLLIAFEQAGNRSKGSQEPLEERPGVVDAIAALLPHTDPDLVAVRAWLKENLNVPEWEEIRWWPRRDMSKWYRDSSPDIDWSKAPPAEPIFLCRLKYRSKNEQGATVLFDDAFEIKNGRAFKYHIHFGGSLFPD
jgi:hypothetical protein